MLPVRRPSARPVLGLTAAVLVIAGLALMACGVAVTVVARRRREA